MYGSIYLVTDKIERQIRKNKTKIAKKHREKLPASQIFTSEFEADVSIFLLSRLTSYCAASQYN